jgi:hypothetical protein
MICDKMALRAQSEAQTGRVFFYELTSSYRGSTPEIHRGITIAPTTRDAIQKVSEGTGHDFGIGIRALVLHEGNVGEEAVTKGDVVARFRSLELAREEGHQGRAWEILRE